jgi:hypothetical protein
MCRLKPGTPSRRDHGCLTPAAAGFVTVFMTMCTQPPQGAAENERYPVQHPPARNSPVDTLCRPGITPMRGLHSESVTEIEPRPSRLADGSASEGTHRRECRGRQVKKAARTRKELQSKNFFGVPARFRPFRRIYMLKQRICLPTPAARSDRVRRNRRGRGER